MLVRTPEPELMNEEDQVLAYSNADFAEAHNALLGHLKRVLPAGQKTAQILDLGCGPGDMTFRLYKMFTNSSIHAIDGSEAMVESSRRFFAPLLMCGGAPFPVKWSCGLIQDVKLADHYDLIFSNSLLHHIHRPADFWNVIKSLSTGSAFVFVSDLKRPSSDDEAKQLADRYSAGQPEILCRDFYNSLLAAFRPDEVEAQLNEAGLSLQVEPVSDRHLIVYGLI